MSTVTVEQMRRWLRVPHEFDDELLQEMIDQAEDEALRFLNRTQPPTLPQDYPPEYDSDGLELSEPVPSSEDPAAKSFVKGVCILVQASYEAADPDRQARMRANAFDVLFPYRVGLGV